MTKCVGGGIIFKRPDNMLAVLVAILVFIEVLLITNGIFGSKKKDTSGISAKSTCSTIEIATMMTTQTLATALSHTAANTTSDSQINTTENIVTSQETSVTSVKNEKKYNSTEESNVITSNENIIEGYGGEDKKANNTVSFVAKYYCGGSGTYGYYGRDLISGYSVATWEYPNGTLLYIESDSLFPPSGIYRVDDTGCPYGVIDFYYEYGAVPSDFAYHGISDIRVSVAS